MLEVIEVEKLWPGEGGLGMQGEVESVTVYKQVVRGRPAPLCSL